MKKACYLQYTQCKSEKSTNNGNSNYSIKDKDKNSSTTVKLIKMIFFSQSIERFQVFQIWSSKGVIKFIQSLSLLKRKNLAWLPQHTHTQLPTCRSVPKHALTVMQRLEFAVSKRLKANATLSPRYGNFKPLWKTPVCCIANWMFNAEWVDSKGKDLQ